MLYQKHMKPRIVPPRYGPLCALLAIIVPLLVSWDLPAASPPTAPTAVSASDGTYYDKIRVTWNSVAGATGYDLRRYFRNDLASAVVVGSTTTNWFEDTKASLSLSHYYWVFAKNAAGTSPNSAPDSGWIATLQPPTGVSASDGDTHSIFVWWNAVTGASGYKLWRNNSDNPSTAVSVGVVSVITGPAYQDADKALIIGSTYYYWVQATNSIQTSVFSTSDSGRIAPLQPLQPPAWLSASDAIYADAIMIRWNPVAGAAGYWIWRSSSDNTATAVMINSTWDIAYHDAPLLPGSTYYYWVKATNALYTSVFSSSDSGYVGVAQSPVKSLGTDLPATSKCDHPAEQ